MNSLIASRRIDDGLEKQATSANGNFTPSHKEDAVNKVLSDWIRRQMQGINLLKASQEETTMKIDDLQILLVEKSLNVRKGKLSVDSDTIPSNYRYYNKLSVYASKGNCSNVLIPSIFVENGNVDEYLSDATFSPSFEFEQCFHVLLNDKFRIFTGNNFEVDRALLSYYRNPLNISFQKEHLKEEWEWKEDVAELIIDEAIKYLAGNIEHLNAYQTTDKRLQENI